MPNDTNQNLAIGIVGSDGQTPIYQPDARWAIYSIHEIWLGLEGKNKYIPKVDDYVIEPKTGIVHIVTDLNNVTFVPELSPIQIKQTTSTDELVSSTTDNYRLYFDKSNFPYTVNVDGFMRVYSATASVARIYQGMFIDETKIVSRRYDNSSNFIGHDIPLQMAAYNTHDNFAIKYIPGCSTNIDLKDGDTCTVVVFDSSGKVLTRATCIVEETSYVAPAYAEQKYITEIFMRTVFADATQPNIINYPVNLPVKSFNPIGVVQYNDGSQIEYVVDGDKFTIYGLDQFVSTITGHRVPLVLNYRMDPTEAATADVTVQGDSVTRGYDLVVSTPNRSYNVKLFVYPVWVDAVTGYNFRVYLMNLDRNILFDVTNHIGIATNSPAFNPLGYGVTQRIIFTLDLSKVSGIYNSFLHVQTVDIVLRGPVTSAELATPWEVGSQVPSTIPYFGSGIRATVDNVTNKKLSLIGPDTLEEFIDLAYVTTAPLFNTVTELKAPTPTHVEFIHKGESVLKPISDYNKEVVFQTAIPKYSNVEVVFHKETISGFLKLSLGVFVVR